MSDLMVKNIFGNYPVEVEGIAEVFNVSSVSVYSWRSEGKNVNSAGLKLRNQYVREKFSSKYLWRESRIISYSVTPHKGDSNQVSLFNRNAFLESKDMTQIELFEKLDVSQQYTPGAEMLDPAGRLQPDNYVSVPYFTDVDLYNGSADDSVCSKSCHGDIIIYKQVNTTVFFAFYEPYAIVTKTNNQRSIKYIDLHPSDGTKLSYDLSRYPARPIDREEIFETVAD